MTAKLQRILFQAASILEVVIGVILVGVIAVCLVFAVRDCSLFLSAGSGWSESFNQQLSKLFSIIIGIELLKMLCRHSLGSCVEVVLFAVARGMIVNHSTPLETLLGVLALGILFCVRKYLFIPGLDNPESQNHHHNRKHRHKNPAENKADAEL